MRTIKYIVLHCTATDPHASVSGILRYWKDNLGWKSPGYHFLIEANGTVHELQPIEKPSNGVAGYNQTSIHISYVGGIDTKGTAKDTRTPEQIDQQVRLLKDLHMKFPSAIIQGHRDFPGVKKECPSFDVRKWLKTIQL